MHARRRKICTSATLHPRIGPKTTKQTNTTMMFIGHLRHTKFLAAAKKLVLKHHMLTCKSFCGLVVE